LNLRQCDWKPYVPEADLQSSLLRAQVLVVTQRPETRGLLWPSKLALVSTLPRPILWIGPVDGAIAHMLRDLPSAGIFAPGQATQIADWLESLQKAGATSPIQPTQDATQQRTLSLKKWGGLLA
jgi:colanic acid biosynthesis glycosyl transferase WcaI